MNVPVSLEAIRYAYHKSHGRRYMSLAGFLLLMLVAQAASAHRFAPSLLRIEPLGTTLYSLTWKTPLATISQTPLQPRLPASCSEREKSPWLAEGTGKMQRSIVHCQTSLIGETIEIAGIAENQTSVVLMVRLHEGPTHQAVLTPDQTRFLVPAVPKPTEVILRYATLGAEHIWGGFDHLLFVMGLLLLVGGGKRLVLTVTAFTLGHSVTLALVTLGLFSYPVALIEFLIALSIFMLAVELTQPRDQSRLWRHPWWLAGGFGLLHGMGFAGALAETGLPQANAALALLFFNVGIEFGQLAFIAVLLVVGTLVVRSASRVPDWVQQLPVLLLGTLSAMWCIERGLLTVRGWL